jgi:hypothetical protein
MNEQARPIIEFSSEDGQDEEMRLQVAALQEVI